MTTVNQESLVAEIDSSLTDAVRRAANRAEHLRLTRLQGLMAQLKEQLGVTSSTVSSTDQ